MTTLSRQPNWDAMLEYVSVAEACQETGYHPDHLRRLIRQGKIEASKKGVWWVHRDSLRAYMEMVETLGTKKFDPYRGASREDGEGEGG